MKLHQQYLLLHSQLGETSEHTITLADLSLILDCTHRNTLTIVKKWLLWAGSIGMPGGDEDGVRHSLCWLRQIKLLQST